ncbi:nucleolar pre-ribosomal-associated protein 1-like [Acipenser ruthenus]|uniref:nucleolar pre-ribosomal-associated protein 1-like n=1 Tax=Acipenser ruthenus TaxID=7906 RepID=UPI00145A04BB|nr:nucleolar pre-ribosomal-associated protein 1-like [Acipenser ruthenus]
MSKKRKNEGLEESNPGNVKKAKVMEVEFTGTQFKSMLKEPAKALKGLDIFISISKTLPSCELYDVVEGYIKISMECAEIFKLLEGEKHQESEMVLIFQTLEAILLRTASDLSHFSMVGMAIVKKVLSSHMKLIYAALYSDSHRYVRLCLNLLSAMVSQGPDSAREVFSHFDFSKSLSGLAKKRDRKGRPDVRMAYTQFALSFIITGDTNTVGKVLELKDFIPDILSTGLKEDRISTVNLLLSTLQTKVVQNKAINKTQKVRFFNPVVLSHIASLYRWNGIVDTCSDDTKDIELSKEAGKVLVGELAHNFLLDLCCSLKYGINFYDSSLGTAKRAGNIVLLRFIVGLKTATEEEIVGDLVVNILKVCPDLLQRYFKETQYSFVPRQKSAWLNNIKLLRKIYEAQPEISKAFNTREFIPLPRLLSMVMVTTVPSVCNKATFTQGLNLDNKVVKHTTLSLVAFILKRVLKNIEYCLDKKVWQSSDIYSASVMEDFAQQYREAVSKVLPDLTNIVATWQSLNKREKVDDGGKVEEKVSSKQAAEELQEHGFDDPEITLLKAVLLQVVCLYQKVVPHLVTQSTFDFSKLLKGIVTEKGIGEEVPPVLQYQILQLSLELPASKFSWFRFQDMSDTKETSGETSVFYLLLKMFVTNRNTHLKTSTRLLILKVLRDSGVFEYTWKELELWLKHLVLLPEPEQETVILFLERVLIRVVSNPYPYTDKAASLVQEAAMLQVNLSGQEGDAVSVPISHIDDVLDMVDVIVEGSEGLDEEIGSTLNEDMILQTFPFSAVVPAALEARNKLAVIANGEIDVVLEYIISVLTDILHTQHDPLPLCLTIQLYDKEIDSSESKAKTVSVVKFYHYYSHWIPAQAKETLFKESGASASNLPPPHGSFSCLLKNAHGKDANCLLQDQFKDVLGEAVSTLKHNDLPVAIKHIMLYIKTCVDNFKKFTKSTGVALLGFYMNLLRSLIHRLEYSEEPPESSTASAQEELDLFMDCDYLTVGQSDKEEELVDMLASIFKHPTLDQWFMSMELETPPPHNLNPVSIRLLSSQLNSEILRLLKLSAPVLQRLGHLDLISKYMSAIEKSVLKELAAGKSGGRNKRIPGKKSQPMEGLEALHPYMEANQLKEVVSSMLMLPEDNLTVADHEDETVKKLSIYGLTLVQVLTENCQQSSRNEILFLSSEQFKVVGSLLQSCTSKELDKVILQALQRDPVYAQLIQTDVLIYCLSHMTETCQSIAAFLIQHCRIHMLQFEMWCLKPGRKKLLSNNLEAFLSLVNVYLKYGSQEDITRPKYVRTLVITVLKEAFLKKLVNSVLSDAVANGLPLQLEVVCSLIQFSVSLQDLADVISQLPALLEKTENYERWQLVDCVSKRLDTYQEDQAIWKKSLLTASTKWLINSYSSRKEQEEEMKEKEKDMLLRLQELVLSFGKVTAGDWNNFVKSGLKYRYRDPAFLEVLNSLLTLLYKSDDTPKDLVPLPMIHMMIMNHSLFLPTMLKTVEEQDVNPQSKDALVDVLLTLVKNCASVCESNHFAVLLGAYGATLNTTDQKLLLLLQEYERNNVSLAEFRLLLWGPAAVEHHKARKSLGKSLWQQPSTEEILALLNREKMLHTILHFPQHRRIIPEEGKDMLFKDDRIKDLDALYDPCFLLTLFSALVKPESVVDCYKFVDMNALGVTVAALSSYDPKVRAAAYQVLGSFYLHLEGARFREKRQLLCLMDAVKNGIKQQNLRLTFSMAMYITKVAQQMLKPEEHMYQIVNKFLLSHQYLDLKKVPGFFKLFYSFDLEHKMERNWVLALLTEGLKDKDCYKLYNHQGIFHVLLAFFSSPLCEESAQNQILNILQQASHVTKAAYELIRDHSLLTWMLQILEKRFIESKLLSSIISLVHNLWNTNLGDKESDDVDESLLGKKTHRTAKCLPLPLINEFVGVLTVLIRHIWTNVEFQTLAQLLKTLSSVLKHRTTALDAYKETGRIVLKERTLSGTDVLMLLHKWSLVSNDVHLLQPLLIVAKKYKVKDLLKTVKERSRSRGSFLHSRRKVEDPAEEETTGELQKSSLEMCEQFLRTAFIHWEPVIHSVHLSSDGSGQMSDLPVKENNTSNLACATAYLVVKWELNSIVGCQLNSNHLLLFLKWFQKNILPHSSVVEELHRDSSVRLNFLQLYHRAAELAETYNMDLDIFHAFSCVMIQLLEAQSSAKTRLHETIKMVCLPSVNEEDNTRRAAGLFLLSVYIHDAWSGAVEHEMFLTHIKLVTEASEELGKAAKTPKGKKSKKGGAAVVSVCKEISSFLKAL